MLAACSQAMPGSESQDSGTSRERSEDDFSYDLLAWSLEFPGADVEEVGQITQDSFAVPGRLLRVDRTEIQVFEFAVTGEARQPAASISSGGSTVGTTMIAWVSRPHFFLNGRMIVLCVGKEESIVSPVKGAMRGTIAVGGGLAMLPLARP